MDKVTYNVHRVINGPFECENGDWWLTCSVEDVEAKEMFEDDIPFVSFDAAYKFQVLLFIYDRPYSYKHTLRRK